MTPPTRLLRALLLPLLLTGSLLSPTQASTSSSTLNLEFRTYLWPTPATPPTTTLGYYTSQPEPLQSPPGRLSPTYRYHGPNPLRFYRQSGPSAAPQLIYSLNLPTEARKLLLIIRPPEAPAQSYQIYPIPTDSANLPRGQGRIYNLTQEPLALKLGQQQMLLQPGASERIPYANANGRTLQTQLASQDEEDQWVPQHIRDIVLDSTDTPLLFLLHSPRPGQYRILTLNPQS